MHNIRYWDLWNDNLAADHDVVDLYQDVFDCIGPSFRETLFPLHWPDREDPHPTPAEHLAFLDIALPGWVTKESTRVIIREESINLNKNPRKSGISKVTRL
jgi:hypothetical protein